MDELLEQGIYICETEMSQLEETKKSFLCKFTTIQLSEEEAIKNYLKYVEQNEKAYKKSS